MSVEQRQKIAAAKTRPLPEFKVCPRCGERKHRGAYKVRADGRTLYSYCIPCHREYGAIRSRTYRERHPHVKETDRVQNRRTVLRIKYGITPERYDEMLAAQGGRCAICGSDNPASARAKNFAVDHDHETGAIRGILCHPCNLMLGGARDDVEVFRSAIAYLERSRP